MNLKRSVIILGASCFLLITWWRWELIVASALSFVGSSALMAMNPGQASCYADISLFEYWSAGVAWLLLGVVLILRIIKVVRVSNEGDKWSVSSLLLFVMTVVALAAPILTPVPPNVQGNLITTRLLSPLSVGAIETIVTRAQTDESVGSLERIRIDANNYLLNRQIVVMGKPQELNTSTRLVFIFGSDDVGRDVLSRVIAGARVSLAIGAIVAVGSVVIGMLIGFFAGYTGTLIDSLLMRLTDLFLAIPSLFLVIGVIAFLGQSLTTLVAVLTLTGWMSVARTVRTEIRKLRGKEFVHAARMLNQSGYKILIKHLLPNLKPILFTATILQFGNAILAEAALSFLGLGVQPPTASWGNMLGQSVSYLRTGWWLAFFPGLLLSTVLLAVHQKFETATDAND